MQQYNPRTVLRQVPNLLLARFFSPYPGFSGFDWSQVKEAHPEPIFERWQQLPEGERRRIGSVFRQVHALANPSGTGVLIESARDNGLDIVEELRAMKNAHQRAFWCLLEHPEVFDNARTLSHIDGLPQRSSEKWVDLPKRPLVVTAAILGNLERAIADYYQKREGRGEQCRVEHRRRSGNIDSFFAYPADYVDEVLGYDEDGEFARTRWQGVFEVAFRYNGGDGTLELYAEGGKRVRKDLADLFLSIVFGEDPRAKPAEKSPYRLEVFKNPQLSFPTDPADSIAVRVKGLRLQVNGSRDSVIAVDAGGQSHRSAYAVLDETLDQQRVPLEKCTVLDATLHAVVRTPRKRPRSIIFKVSPSTCTLGDSQEEEKLRGYLKHWQIEDGHCA